MGGVERPMFRFGRFEFDLRRQELRRAGVPLRLPPQPTRLLSLLLERSGEMVTREEIQNRLWADGVFVDFEQGINHAIRHLREVLGDDASTPRMIETVPRVGYRFLPGVERLDGAAGDSRFRPAPLPESAHAADDSHKPPGPAVVGPAHLSGSTGAVTAGDKTSRSPFRLAWHFPILVGGIALATTLPRILWVDPEMHANTSSDFVRMRISQLTGGGNLDSAAISPDGRHFAYCSRETGGFAVRLRSIATEDETTLVESLQMPALWMTFSPDGERLWYVHRDEARPSYSLYSVATLGGPEKEIVFDVDSGAAVSPDGSRVAFVRGNHQTHEGAVILASSRGLGERTVARSQPPSEFMSLRPAWSPDGERIAVGLLRDRARAPVEIHVLDVETGHHAQLGDEGWWSLTGIAWRADGAALFVAGWAANEDREQIWRISWPEGEATRVSNDLDSYQSLSLAADGRNLVSLRLRWTSMLHTFESDAEGIGVEWANGVRSQDRIYMARPLPGGGAIFTKRRGDGFGLWLQESPGTQQRELLPETVMAGWSFGLSPDGTRVVFLAYGGSDAIHLVAASLEGGGPSMVAGGTSGTFPVFCGSSERVLFLRRDLPGLWEASPGRGPARRLGGPAPYSTPPVCSSDGRWVAYDTLLPADPAAERALVVLPAEGGEPVLQVPWPVGRGLRWSPDDSALTFLDGRPGATRLMSLPLAGGAPVVLRDLPEGWVFDYAWTYDGLGMLVVIGEGSTDAVLIRDLS